VGALKTSEQGDAVAGEGRKDSANDDRPVDTGAKIIISAGPTTEPSGSPHVVAPPRPRPQRPTKMPTAEPRRAGGLGLVILLYLMSAVALGYAIYERFVVG